MSGNSEKYKEIFSTYDKNHNDSIDKSEFDNFFRHVLSNIGESMSEEDIEEALKEGMAIFDSNGNQTLELAEFSKIMDFIVEEKGYKIKK